MLHRNIANNVDEATAWYWLFNEWSSDVITNDAFTDGLHAFVAVNGMNVKRDAVNKEFNCVKNTYVCDKSTDKKNIMDEDTYPFFGPLHILKFDGKQLIKKHLTEKEIPVEVLIYAIANDNKQESKNHGQVGIDTLMEGKCQVGRYFNIRYTDLIDMLIEAENKGYIALNNNFGNRLIEFNDTNYDGGEELRTTQFDKQDLSSNGQIMFNKMKATISNFGESISQEEKMQIIARLLEEIM